MLVGMIKFGLGSSFSLFFLFEIIIKNEKSKDNICILNHQVNLSGMTKELLLVVLILYILGCHL